MQILPALYEKTNRLDYGLKAMDVSRTIELNTTATMKFRVVRLSFSLYQNTNPGATVGTSDSLVTSYATTPALQYITSDETTQEFKLTTEGKDLIGTGFLRGSLPEFWDIQIAGTLPLGVLVQEYTTQNSQPGDLFISYSRTYEVGEYGTFTLEGIDILPYEEIPLFSPRFSTTHTLNITDYAQITIEWDIRLEYYFPITDVFAMGFMNAIFGQRFKTHYESNGTLYDVYPTNPAYDQIVFHSDPIGKGKYD